jgi:N-acetylmuramoyl-L-alanine amidase
MSRGRIIRVHLPLLYPSGAGNYRDEIEKSLDRQKFLGYCPKSVYCHQVTRCSWEIELKTTIFGKTPMTTVKEAIDDMLRSRVVDTGRVSGLSRQIIAQMNNLQTGILLNFESLPGIVSSQEPHLNLFLQSGPKESLRLALREGTTKQPNLKMTVNSAYRTVAQQYILFQLYRRDRKLVPLAAIPGNSNHEDGMAIDVNNFHDWKPYLLNHGWQWQGNSDSVHFFDRSGRDDVGSLGVQAFQSLWNKYHPEDRIPATGQFGDLTAARMDRSPIGGFGAVAIFQQGDTGAAIERIQAALTKMGFSVPVTGTFGSQTKDAVIKFQHKYGLSADGSVGPLTLKKLGIG